MVRERRDYIGKKRDPGITGRVGVEENWRKESGMVMIVRKGREEKGAQDREGKQKRRRIDEVERGTVKWEGGEVKGGRSEGRGE